MNQEERKNYILERLKISSSVSVAELSEAFGLSEVSVRKLLSEMEQEGGAEANLGRGGKRLRLSAGIFSPGE